MEQRTDNWIEWRKKGIGSSDAAAIMDASPYTNAYKVWEEKTGRRQPPESNWAMQRGIDLEPKVRALYELEHDYELPATLVQHAVHDFIRASLDGYCTKTGRILEIKCPGQANHDLAVSGKVPEHYQWQLTHQLLAAGGECVDYVSYKDGQIAVVEFRRDPEMEARLLEAEIKFWQLVQSDTPPEKVERPKRTRKQGKSELGRKHA